MNDRFKPEDKAPKTVKDFIHESFFWSRDFQLEKEKREHDYKNWLLTKRTEIQLRILDINEMLKPYEKADIAEANAK